MNDNNVNRRVLFVIGALLLLLLAAPFASAQRVLLDKIIAIVDDDVVLKSELDERIVEITAAAQRNGQPLPDDLEQFESDIMEALIVENIQMQLANRVSIRYDDDTINRVLGNMASNNNLTFDQYVDALEENGVYLQTREQVRKQMTMQELQRGMVNRRIKITEQEIDNFLNSEMGRELMAADYFVDDLLIPFSAADTPEIKAEKQRLAADLISRIDDDFPLAAARAAARQNTAIEIGGAELGWRKAKQLPSLFADIVVDMEIGQVEGPIEAGNGLHIIQLVDMQGGTEQFVNQTRVRHIMLSPNEIRNEEQTEAEARKIHQRILDGEDFATIARQNSDDASSVVGGGDLDWVNEGGMPPEMEQVVDALEIDGVSEPFRSQVGWHVARVEGRRLQDLSREFTRNQAANALRNRKFELELENWLIEIREDAFVELID
ncbi:peptidylprolyl isomerase [Gammaproteobacteria bacterium]|jgi:peptidyl-prolyl cis-trans isomerase SurA|nr:peptidylprolyl isomerase [Gammaproteobacteria bacterium]MDO7565701.1 peptidylprolyl isomerase [OM182 bacterium]MDB3890395.1 peptidylprolyl isomerase [Gammaproteobacteria bacterium]MDB4165994.1 peptidylprolyl isomerase [Gammaproteobacteria bacterium]MDC1232315.1 peptidylprolyl isomerase [Gammaproteobacteria bacterium]